MDQLAMFDMQPIQLPEPRPGKKWGGRRSTNARAIVTRMLPGPCTRCGGLVTPEMDWHADHLQERGLGGADVASNYGPAHAKCNTSAGGKIGAAITNGSRVSVADHVREKTLKWW